MNEIFIEEDPFIGHCGESCHNSGISLLNLVHLPMMLFKYCVQT